MSKEEVEKLISTDLRLIKDQFRINCEISKDDALTVPIELECLVSDMVLRNLVELSFALVQFVTEFSTLNNKLHSPFNSRLTKLDNLSASFSRAHVSTLQRRRTETTIYT